MNKEADSVPTADAATVLTAEMAQAMVEQLDTLAEKLGRRLAGEEYAALRAIASGAIVCVPAAAAPEPVAFRWVPMGIFDPPLEWSEWSDVAYLESAKKCHGGDGLVFEFAYTSPQSSPPQAEKE